jgi:serine/threonine-protein kinase
MSRVAENLMPPLVPPPASLHQIAGYRLLRLLGHGGMSDVYLGYDGRAGFPVAVKILAADLAQDQVQVDRFEREAKICTRLNHPNIVLGLDSGQDEQTGRRFLVLEYVDGPNAQALLDRIGRLDVTDVAHIALAIARALEHLHAEQLVHRDIKPANILLSPDGEARLTDLGLVKWNDKSSAPLTATFAGFGTSNYMPLEQARNAHFVDGRSDIFALGATLYHLATGRVPFPGDDHGEITRMKEAGTFTPARLLNPKIPESLETILHKMLARDPRRRYQTAGDLIVALERTGLAVGYPSYGDLTLIRCGPTLAHSTEPTRPDLRLQQKDAPETPRDAIVWYLSYKGRKGDFCLKKGTTEQVIDAVRSGKLTGKLLASRQRDRHYRPILDFPEFHCLASDLSKDPNGGVGRQMRFRSRLTAIAAAITFFCLTAAVVCRFFVRDS